MNAPLSPAQQQRHDEALIESLVRARHAPKPGDARTKPSPISFLHTEHSMDLFCGDHVVTYPAVIAYEVLPDEYPDGRKTWSLDVLGAYYLAGEQIHECVCDQRELEQYLINKKERGDL